MSLVVALVCGCSSTSASTGEGDLDYVPLSPGPGWNSSAARIGFGVPQDYPCTGRGDWSITLEPKGADAVTAEGGTLSGRTLRFTMSNRDHVIEFITDTKLTLDGNTADPFTVDKLEPDFTTGTWAVVGKSDDSVKLADGLSGTFSDGSTVTATFDGTLVHWTITRDGTAREWSGPFWGDSEIRLKSNGDSMTLRRQECS